MEVHELVIEMKLLERRLTLYEEKYGVLSEDFYAALMSGELADYDDELANRVHDAIEIVEGVSKLAAS